MMTIKMKNIPFLASSLNLIIICIFVRKEVSIKSKTDVRVTIHFSSLWKWSRVWDAITSSCYSLHTLLDWFEGNPRMFFFLRWTINVVRPPVKEILLLVHDPLLHEKVDHSQEREEIHKIRDSGWVTRIIIGVCRSSQEKGNTKQPFHSTHSMAILILHRISFLNEETL